MKILVIRFSSIGDIVLTSPVFRCIKEQIPGAELHFLTKKKFKAVTLHNPHIDKFFYYDKNLPELRRDLKAERYDCIIDLHKNFRSYLVRLALRRKTYSYRKLSLEKFLLTKWKINTMLKRHIVQRNLDTLLPLGVRDDGGGMEYFLGPGDEKAPDSLPDFCRNGFIAIVIGASYYTKKLPVHKLKELCSALHYPTVLVGGKEDETLGDEVASLRSDLIYNACGKFSLNQSAALVKKAKVVISHDTGLQYIACAFNRPVLAVWGGTSPKLDVEPYYGNHSERGDKFTYRNFVVPGLRCQPCSRYGTRSCPKGHFKCMELQDIGEITRTALDVLGK